MNFFCCFDAATQPRAQKVPVCWHGHSAVAADAGKGGSSCHTQPSTSWRTHIQGAQLGSTITDINHWCPAKEICTANSFIFEYFILDSKIFKICYQHVQCIYVSIFNCRLPRMITGRGVTNNFAPQGRTRQKLLCPPPPNNNSNNPKPQL